MKLQKLPALLVGVYPIHPHAAVTRVMRVQLSRSVYIAQKPDYSLALTMDRLPYETLAPWEVGQLFGGN